MKKKSSTNNEFRDAFPVIQLSYDRKLVKSNLTALPLLNQWNCRKGSKIPKNILEMYPEIEYSMKDSLDPSLAVATIFDLHYEPILEVLSAHFHCHSPDHYGYSGQDFFHSSWYLNSCLFLLNY
jgi:hypothetical protein